MIAAWMFCLRGPNAAEIRTHCSELSKGRSIAVDTKQSDIGYFEVRIEGEEPFFIEASPQWIFPGGAYDWSL